MKSTVFFLVAILMLANCGYVDAQQDLNVEVDVFSQRKIGPLKPIWRFFGADEPNYAYMKDGRKLLGQLGAMSSARVFFRTHNLLTTGPGTPGLKWGSTNVYTEDADGNPIYDWQIVDLIFDTYLANNIRPYVQLGFMPKALSVHPDPYEHQWRPGLPYDDIYTGWAYPPKDYDKWRELVYQWALHCRERYGLEEVETWYWETWNESNIGYWKGTPEEFRKLHDYTIDGVLQAIPNARVGGADTAGDGGNFTKAFLDHCLRGENYANKQVGTRLDFISFHAKGAPTWQQDHIRMGIAAQLKTIDTGFQIVSSFPELKSTPIMIGESDPEGCAACQGDKFSYRNGTMYSSYTAASFARKHDLAAKHGVNLEGALTWAFTFEDQPYFAGFRQLASNGIPLPVLNVFRMMAKMPHKRVQANSSHMIPLPEIVANGVRAEPDVGVLASGDDNSIAIMLWYYHDEDLKGPDASIQLRVNELSKDKEVIIEHCVVDHSHSNAYQRWLDMGRPIAPNREQYDELNRVAELFCEQEIGYKTDADGGLVIESQLARQAVHLYIVRW